MPRILFVMKLVFAVLPVRLPGLEPLGHYPVQCTPSQRTSGDPIQDLLAVSHSGPFLVLRTPETLFWEAASGGL